MSREAEIADRLAAVQGRIAEAAQRVGRTSDEIVMIAVTKNFPLSDAEILYDLGVRDFGENRDEEGALKSEQLPSDLRWHFQGQIQGRKIKSIMSWADFVHSLDSLEHARKFASLPAVSQCGFFLQVNLEPERVDRGGVGLGELAGFLQQLQEEVQIAPMGLMTVAPLGMEPIAAFTDLKNAQIELQKSFPSLSALSMGMSGDFEEAIGAGATHVRIGSSILGSRLSPA